MRQLFVMDPVDRIDVRGDSTYLLMLEAHQRGHQVAWCHPNELYVHDQKGMAHLHPVTVHTEAPHFRARCESHAAELSSFDVIWMRKDPPFDMDYIFSTYILDLALPNTVVLNDPRSIKTANEKMVALQYPELCPETVVTNKLAHVKEFAQRFDRIVLKPWDGNGGRGVVVTHAQDKNLGSLTDLLTDEGRGYCIAQRYLPEITDGDKRIILIDGEPVGWFLRVPGQGDHRGNMHVGATVHACELSERDQEICAAIGPRLKAEGLLFVGIDVIGTTLTEINVTSPTGLHEVRQLMGGLRLEKTITDKVEALVAARSAP
ncbi:MAG: glutathione synthase [Myxococcota bacterium]|nr:glutathione synthase [Myxococcota bacterium]